MSDTDDTDLGSPVDLSSSSRSFRNNNPGNVAFSPLSQSLGAIGKDAQGFAIFPDLDTGRAAQQQFWQTNQYGDQPIGSAVKRWGGQYAGQLGVDPNQSYSQLSPDQQDTLRQRQQTLEGWKPGAATSSPSLAPLPPSNPFRGPSNVASMSLGGSLDDPANAYPYAPPGAPPSNSILPYDDDFPPPSGTGNLKRTRMRADIAPPEDASSTVMALHQASSNHYDASSNGTTQAGWWPSWFQPPDPTPDNTLPGRPRDVPPSAMPPYREPPTAAYWRSLYEGAQHPMKGPTPDAMHPYPAGAPLDQVMTGLGASLGSPAKLNKQLRKLPQLGTPADIFATRPDMPMAPPEADYFNYNIDWGAEGAKEIPWPPGEQKYKSSIITGRPSEWRTPEEAAQDEAARDYNQ